VRDDGPGMSPAVLEQAFEPFAQGPESGSGSGLGVGLALVRQLVELHGGTVTAKSDGPGRGSEFVVRLPMLRRHSEAARPPAPALETAKEPHVRNIIVVDDNVDAAEMLATMLELRGHHVSIAHDGPDALQHARSAVPDVMLLDIEMPKMSGYDVARAVRDDPRLHAVKLIAISGYGQEDDRARSKQAGFDVHMIKPVDVNALYAALETPG
jgi:CheY-like chemotaxis protein